MNHLPLLALLLLATSLRAEEASARPRDKVRPIPALPAWDAIFSPAIWQTPGTATLMLRAPLKVTFPVPPEKTSIRVLWCKDYLLVRFDCEDRSIVRLPNAEGERDLPYFKADAVELFLDPVGDARMFMEFQFSPDNGVFDALYFCTATPRSTADFSLEDAIGRRDLFSIKEWNLPGLRTVAKIWPKAEGQGWSVIAAFPAGEILHRLGKKEFTPGMELKFNFVRFDYFSGKPAPEVTNWAPVLAGCAHISPAGMGTLILEAP